MDTGKKGTKSIFMQTNFMRHIEENSSIVKDKENRGIKG